MKEEDKIINKMKYIKEFAFWNKDSDIAEMILNNINILEPSEITEERNGVGDEIRFKIKDFDILVIWDCGEFDLIDPTGSYIVKVDNVKIDCSWNQGRKIYNRAKRIKKEGNEEMNNFTKKDIRITLKEAFEPNTKKKQNTPITTTGYDPKYEFENFTASDMDLVKELWEDGMTDPEEIQRELDFKEFDIETVIQIIDTLKQSKEIE